MSQASPPEEKKTFGKSLNELRSQVELDLAQKEKEIREAEKIWKIVLST